MSAGKEITKAALKVGACLVCPAAAPAIVFSEIAKKAVRVAVQSGGGNSDDAKEAEKTAGAILGAGSLLSR